MISCKGLFGLAPQPVCAEPYFDGVLCEALHCAVRGYFCQSAHNAVVGYSVDQYSGVLYDVYTVQ